MEGTGELGEVAMLTQLLSEFDGLDADGVAKKLKSEGIKGVKKQCGCCPIANWLTGKGCEFVVVEVEDVSAIVNGVRCKKDCSQGMQDFIFGFDHGVYDNLEDRSKAMMV